VCVSVYMYVWVAFVFSVNIFTYMSTEFGWVCMWLRIFRQRLHVLVIIYVYRYTGFHVLCIFAYMYTEFTWMCTWNDSQCVYTCVGYGLR